MTHPSDIAGLSERLRAQVTSDHVRGCEGRNYSCDCGYDLSTEGLLELAATALDSLSARVKELERDYRAADASDTSARDLLNDLEAKMADAESRALRAEQQRDEAYERAAKYHDERVEAIALYASEKPSEQRAMACGTLIDFHRKSAAAIRRLASGPDNGAKP